MLVCNTHETAMLAVTGCPSRFTLLRRSFRHCRAIQKGWKDWMDGQKLRHSGKLRSSCERISGCWKTMGEVPDDRDALQEMNGVGRHVASDHGLGPSEAGVRDRHARQPHLKRWGFINGHGRGASEASQADDPGETDRASRAFVDHGRQVWASHLIVRIASFVGVVLQRRSMRN